MPEMTGALRRLEQAPLGCSGWRPLRPAGFTPARPYQSECAAGGRYGGLETALILLQLLVAEDDVPVVPVVLEVLLVVI